MENSSLNLKGQKLEELLRAYFLRVGFYVVRGVPYLFNGEELTDIDLWLYDHSAAGIPITQICDIKNKKKSKTIERLFWTKGLAEAIGINTAYVASNDDRSYLNTFSKRLNIQLIDRPTIRLIKEDKSILFEDRIEDEFLINEIQKINQKNFAKIMLSDRNILISSIPEGFGNSTLNIALHTFSKYAKETVKSHPNSPEAKLSGRLAYFAAAIACISLDKISIEVRFRTKTECEEHILNVIRSGAIQNGDNYYIFERATKLVEKYLNNATAKTMKMKLWEDIKVIPAEIVSKQSVRLKSNRGLFNVGREFELASYLKMLPTFDNLSIPAKSMLGALLDFSSITRERFANAWEI